MDQESTSREKLWEIIKKTRFAIFVTREPREAGAPLSQAGDEVLRSRPLTTIQKEFDGTLWFFVSRTSSVVAAVNRNPQVCLAYADTGDADFVTVSGAAAVVDDVAQKQSLWNSMVQAWFPAGPESPAVVLVKVAAESAEYWDSTSNKLVQLFGMARALVTGTQPKHMGEHHQVQLNSN
jgi:general stress protein 26